MLCFENREKFASLQCSTQSLAMKSTDIASIAGTALQNQNGKQ